MNEQPIETYLCLIQQLLDCPSGEENQILDRSLDLLDQGFVDLCETMAAEKQEIGAEDEANFLRNIADYVETYLNGEEDSFNFLMDLLQATSDSNGNSSVVYPMLQQNLDKLDLNLAEILQDWANQVLPEIDAHEGFNIAVDIGNFGNLIQRFPLGSRAANLEIAIAAYNIISTVFTCEAFPEQWATVQNNLGSAYSHRIFGERSRSVANAKSQNLEMCIFHYQAALEVYTREAFPEQWAMTQNNLGIAYFYRIFGERSPNLEMSIAYYQAALEVYTREAFPEQWAMTQNNLGNAYNQRICGEKSQNLEIALACHEAALAVRTREAFPEYWADSQTNLGEVYRNRICGERSQNLEMAIAYYQAALEVRTREAFPEQWATTQNNLGLAYNERICGDRSRSVADAKSQNLEIAIACHQAALTILTREAFPEYWAATQNDLGEAYLYRICGDRSENLEMAITYYKAALEVYTREAFPEQWAMTQNNLGAAYFNRISGERSRSVADAKSHNLEMAITYYQAALEIYTREAFPQQHNQTLFNLDNARNCL